VLGEHQKKHILLSFSSPPLLLHPVFHPHELGDPASPTNSLSIFVTAFHMSYFLYWHWKAWMIPYPMVAMACANWRDKYNFNIFQSSGISWVCNTLVNEEQDFSVFCPCLAILLHK